MENKYRKYILPVFYRKFRNKRCKWTICIFFLLKLNFLYSYIIITWSICVFRYIEIKLLLSILVF